MLCATNNIAIDCFICGLINIASCQFELLKWNLAKIGSDSKTQHFSPNAKEYVNEKLNNTNVQLRRCIQHNLVIFE